MAIPGSGIAKGMATTFRNFFSPKVTRQYPEQRPDIPDRWRGRLDLIYDPFGEHKCEVCFQCAQVCPVEAIDMSGFDSRGQPHPLRHAGDLRRAPGRERLPSRGRAGQADAQPGALGRGDRHAFVDEVIDGFGGAPGGARRHLPSHRGDATATCPNARCVGSATG